MLYDDGRIACDDRGLIIGWYYLWGKKRIPYTSIRQVTTRPMSRFRGKWRLWGSGDFVHCYNLDGSRPKKQTVLELDVGGRVRPMITPDDPETVFRILSERSAGRAT